ncbi:MFS transporter [Streptomyces sp. NPDC006207]
MGAVFGAALLGPLGDRIGRSRVFKVELSLFVVSSVACAFAWDISSLIVFRLLLGSRWGWTTRSRRVMCSGRGRSKPRRSRIKPKHRHPRRRAWPGRRRRRPRTRWSGRSRRYRARRTSRSRCPRR